MSGAEFAILTHGEMEIEGRLVDASNTTLRVQLTLDGAEIRAVYKPIRGERPLWDFPDGTLADREVGAYKVSEALGWGLVPPTILRDGPLGPGMCQLWIEDQDDPPVGFIPAAELPDGWSAIAAARDDDGEPYLLAHADTPDLARMALFDAVVNNADRKGGHVLATGGRLLGVDHGICFHAEPKLRTVLWGFAGREISDELRVALKGLRLDGLLDDHLTAAEIQALADRIGALATLGVYPLPDQDRHVIPWPPI